MKPVHQLFSQIEALKKGSYLELGIGKGRTFSQVIARSKTSVDTNGNADFTGTTDEFFASLGPRKKWDFIFIDANHDLRQVCIDFDNSVRRCKKWVMVHDMIPPSERFTASQYCSDSYRLLHYLWSNDYPVFPMNDYYGLTFVKMPVTPVGEVWRNPKISGFSYASFMTVLATRKLYTDDEILACIEEDNR